MAAYQTVYNGKPHTNQKLLRIIKQIIIQINCSCRTPMFHTNTFQMTQIENEVNYYPEEALHW